MTLKLEHLGHFSLPRGVQAHDPSLPSELAKRAKAGYGGRALALSADRRHLWISGHEEGDLVALWGIPEVAELRIGFRELAPRAALSAAMLDQLVGLADHEGKLWGLYQDYYDVDGKDGGRVSLWDGERLVQVGAGELKRHAGYLTAHDGALWCGRSDGAGSADVQHGPALYRFKPGSLDTPISSPQVYPIPPRADWTEADRYTGLVFLPGHVCWLVSKDVVPRREEIRDGKRVLLHPWYGQPVSPEGLVDRWNKGKGYHTWRREVWLLVYTWPGLEERPTIVLREFHESAKCGGVAYDTERRRLYVHQAWAPPDQDPIPWETPRIEVYAVSTDEAAEPEPPVEPRKRLYIEAWDHDERKFAGEIEEVGG